MKIDKNIPISEVQHLLTKYDEIRETIFAMEIGDSVFFDVYKEAVKFRSRAFSYLKTMPNFNREFKLRTVEDGWRVWRTK